jgi:hypothetical protein
MDGRQSRAIARIRLRDGVIMNSRLPVLSLCKTIKALVAKGDHATKKAEQFYTAAGKHLAELKQRCPDEWLQHAKDKIGIGRSRAYELIAIGTGIRTVEQVRESTRQRVEDHRSRPLRNGQIRWFHEYRTEQGWARGEECPNFVPPCDCCSVFVSKNDLNSRIVPLPGGKP